MTRAAGAAQVDARLRTGARRPPRARARGPARRPACDGGVADLGDPAPPPGPARRPRHQGPARHAGRAAQVALRTRRCESRWHPTSAREWPTTWSSSCAAAATSRSCTAPWPTASAPTGPGPARPPPATSPTAAPIRRSSAAGPGTGASIAANKVDGVRAALCGDAETARGARKWNDANVLALSLRTTSAAAARRDPRRLVRHGAQHATQTMPTTSATSTRSELRPCQRRAGASRRPAARSPVRGADRTRPRRLARARRPRARAEPVLRARDARAGGRAATAASSLGLIEAGRRADRRAAAAPRAPLAPRRRPGAARLAPPRLLPRHAAARPRGRAPRRSAR